MSAEVNQEKLRPDLYLEAGDALALALILDQALWNLNEEKVDLTEIEPGDETKCTIEQAWALSAALIHALRQLFREMREREL